MYENLPTIPRLFYQHIKHTGKEDVVTERTALVCHLTMATSAGLGMFFGKVYVNTKVIKHLYDKKPAEEFDCIIEYGYQIVRYPDEIFKNNDRKRGHYAFIKKLGINVYFCSVQQVDEDALFIVTIFRLRAEKTNSYLKNYKSLWKWKGDGPSS